VILFFEGPDGSGKTTLLTRLADALPAHGVRPITAPALWTFIDPVATPEDFAAWVTTSAGDEVARHLLRAMTRRIDALAPRTPDPGRMTVRLVDRGPKTVLCSARAHAAARDVDRDPTRSRHGLAQYERELNAALQRLGSLEQLVAIELRLPDVDLMISRLSKTERLNESYIQYLDKLRTGFNQIPCHERIAHEVVPAESEVDRNLDAVLSWLSLRTR
jgi:molybdopterin-guanine dinucleotide biosynthesis protein